MTTPEPTIEEQLAIDTNFMNVRLRAAAGRGAWRSRAEIPEGNRTMNDALRGIAPTEEKEGDDAA
jgi:hypothetical protein